MAKVKLTDLQSKLVVEEWDAATNPIYELPENEQKVLLGAVPPDAPPTKTEKKAFLKNVLLEHEAMSAGASATAHPSSFDWRSKNGKNYVTAVKNQTSCGSCVAFGVLSVVESTIRIMKNDPNYNTDLSEAHLFYCLKNDPDGCVNGWWPTGAYEEVKKIGVAKESFYPYVGKQQSCKVSKGWERQKVQITDYKHLNNVNEIKEWIATKGPVSACYEVFSDFFSYKKGIYKHVSGDEGRWHCVSVVGYNDAGGYWICKNSWGANWGENGYFRIKYGECSIEYYGMWGVTGVVDTTWVEGKKVLGLWSNSAPLNTWAFIEGEGWKKIANNNRENHFMLLSSLITAKNMKSKPNIHIKNGMINQIYA